jgi:hypothetical protein
LILWGRRHHLPHLFRQCLRSDLQCHYLRQFRLLRLNLKGRHRRQSLSRLSNLWGLKLLLIRLHPSSLMDRWHRRNRSHRLRR